MVFRDLPVIHFGNDGQFLRLSRVGLQLLVGDLEFERAQVLVEELAATCGLGE